MQRFEIAIAGAGIGGLAAATFLARAGHKVRVFDQFEVPRPIGSGLMLQETGLTILGLLDLRERMEALGAPIRRLHGAIRKGQRTVLDVRFNALRAELKALAVQRGALFSLLLETAQQSGAELMPSHPIASADSATGRLTTRKGLNLGPFDLIVDALGVDSPLIGPKRGALPYGALWATVPWPENGAFADDALEQRYRSAHHMAGVMPSGAIAPGAERKATYFWSIRRDRYDVWGAAPIAVWKDKATTLWPETSSLLDTITDHDDLTFARYRHRTLRRPVEGRVVHIGDAWHATSPQLGQGANTALLDAYALSLGLERHGEIDRAQRFFLKSRRLPVRLYQAMSYLFTPVYQSDSKLLPVVRDWLAAPLSRMPPAPALLAAMVAGAIGSPLRRLDLVPGSPTPVRPSADG